MQNALYHPEHGYYTAWRKRAAGDPFGRSGDFYTAAQLQPVFGRLIAAEIRSLQARMDNPPAFQVVDWGAGRAEMQTALAGFPVVSIDAHTPRPLPFDGVVFANEFFDALCVDVAVRRDRWLLRRVALREDSFAWVDGEEISQPWVEYAGRLASHMHTDEQEVIVELPTHLRVELEAISGVLRSGYLIAIDYGYTEKEVVRFPRGTLMSYRKHRADEDVLSSPGQQDITSHVPFTWLQECAQSMNWQCVRFETLAQLLMRAGEADSFSGAIAGPTSHEIEMNRMKLKTLLFGMGETFRVMLLRREGVV
jgi:SAM-dependent MidA family methyltransferase